MFPQEVEVPLLKRFLALKGKRLIVFTIIIVLDVLVVGILGLLFMFTMLGDWTKYYYIFIATTYFFTLLSILKAFNYLPRPLTILINLGFSLVFGSLWTIFPNWITYDLTGFVCAFVLMGHLKPHRVDLVLALMIAIVAYDTWGVLGDVGGKGGAIVQVVSLLKFNDIGPLGIILTPWGGVLGVGDIVISGMIVALAQSYNCTIETMTGWAVGMLVIFAMSASLHMGLPATIMLVPFTLGAFFLAAGQKKVQLVWI
jgi:hypothetical protein